MIKLFNNKETDVYKKEDVVFLKHDIGIIENFVSFEEGQSMIDFFKLEEQVWGPIAFYGSQGMGFGDEDARLPAFNLDTRFFTNLRSKFQQACEMFFERPLKPNTSHAQKWEVGGFANPHSDNSDMEGNANSFQINKYVGILYLNEDYEGGTLYFPDHNIEIKPKTGQFIMFPGGMENIHGVSEITAGTRYTMVSFWDYAEAEYDKETLAKWEEEDRLVREQQRIQREEWAKGNKNA
jgi:predicted 2-oxoglutarate/Fe(II)-dependent dioxygenase YbiX